MQNTNTIWVLWFAIFGVLFIGQIHYKIIVFIFGLSIIFVLTNKKDLFEKKESTLDFLKKEFSSDEIVWLFDLIKAYERRDDLEIERCYLTFETKIMESSLLKAISLQKRQFIDMVLVIYRPSIFHNTSM